MDPKSFYESLYRRITHATTMSEVIIETIERPRSVVLLRPAGGDECDQASDNEEVPQEFETAFESASEFKVEEDVDDVEENQKKKASFE